MANTFLRPSPQYRFIGAIIAAAMWSLANVLPEWHSLEVIGLHYVRCAKYRVPFLGGNVFFLAFGWVFTAKLPELSTGKGRLALFIGVLSAVAFLAWYIVVVGDFEGNTSLGLLFCSLVAFALGWSLARLGVWVVDGFRADKSRQLSEGG